MLLEELDPARFAAEEVDGTWKISPNSAYPYVKAMMMKLLKTLLMMMRHFLLTWTTTRAFAFKSEFHSKFIPFRDKRLRDVYRHDF